MVFDISVVKFLIFFILDFLKTFLQVWFFHYSCIMLDFLQFESERIFLFDLQDAWFPHIFCLNFIDRCISVVCYINLSACIFLLCYHLHLRFMIRLILAMIRDHVFIPSCHECTYLWLLWFFPVVIGVIALMMNLLTTNSTFLNYPLVPCMTLIINADCNMDPMPNTVKELRYLNQ